MAEVELSFSDFDRIYSDLPAAPLKNRFFEENPFQGKKRAAIARPGTDTLGNYGTGPIRKIFSQPGLFDGALFFVSGDTLYRWDVADWVAGDPPYTITGVIQGDGEVSMSAAKGLDYGRIFIADGTLLQFYGGGTKSTGTFDWTGGANPTEGDTILIGATYYIWTATVTDGIGTSGDPFDVLIGVDWDDSMDNMLKAISFTGTSGVTYSPTLAGQHPLVTATFATPTLTLTSRADGAAANIIALAEVVDGGSNITVSGAFMTGANTHGISGVEIPDGLPPIQVTTLKSYVVVSIDNSDRFYWLEPAAVTIDALDFATAESQPDEVVALKTMQDTLWFIGQGTTEIWYATGDIDLPFSPVSGRVYDRGAIEGTVVNIKGTLYLVDQDYVVYAISGGPKRISNHGIEETIREVIAAET